MEPHPKAGSLVLELASSLNEERTTTMFALRALMMMFPMAVVIMDIVVLPMLMVVFLQRPSKRSTEEIGNLQRLGLDAMMEPVASPSAWAVMLHSPVSSCWAGSVRILEPCDWPCSVRDWVPEAEEFEWGVGGVGVGGCGDTACD